MVFAIKCARKRDRYRNGIFSQVSNFERVLFLVP